MLRSSRVRRGALFAESPHTLPIATIHPLRDLGPEWSEGGLDKEVAMERLLDELKGDARRLHRQARNRDSEALARLRQLPALRTFDDDRLVESVRRRHALSVQAHELGFRGWSHATEVLLGDTPDDFGKLLYPRGADAHWNIWCAAYDEARTIRARHGGYLLTYQRQFFITDRHFVETIGLDPDDPDWERIERDWARPGDLEARRRLYVALIRAYRRTGMRPM